MQWKLVIGDLVVILVDVIDEGLALDIGFLGLEVDLDEAGEEAGWLLLEALVVVKCEELVVDSLLHLGGGFGGLGGLVLVNKCALLRLLAL